MPTPLYRIKLVTNQKYTERPLNTRTCLIVDIFILKSFHYISFVLYRVSCVRNFLAYKLFGSQLLMFFYRTWVPFKSIKKRKRSAVNYKILPCFDSLTALFSVLNIDHEGVKSCSGLSGFSLRPYLSRQKKKSAWSQVNPVFINRFYDEQAYILLFVSFTCVTWIFSTDPRFKLFKEHGIHSFQNDEKLSS